MGWLERCYQTYENNISEVGRPAKNSRGRETPVLLPVAHTTQKVQVEVSLSAAGAFRSARVLRPDEMTTVIPCTEESAARTSGPVPHPLVDKLQYTAGDYAAWGGTKKPMWEAYLAGLRAWCDSPFGLDSLRGAIGVVQQDVYLFSGTVAENIAYGKPGATMEEISRAARLAGAEKFILNLHDGYDTYVGERGVKLSGGQKQRLSIARVFLKNPPILILDEATSALDNESEILVNQSLDKLAHGRTTLTIAHRLTTIKDYDRILVLGAEGILEDGTHDELLAKQGIYYRLWNQLPGDDLLA